MRIQRTSDGDEDPINLSSLLDILFILIIFFLATATFDEEEKDAKVRLPNAGNATLTNAPKPMIINIREDGSMLLGSRVVDLDSLSTALSSAVKDNPEQKVLVRGDQDARHGTVANAILVCRNAGIHEAHIAYAKNE